MARRAKVTSIDAVRTLAASLRCFEEEASEALASLDLEVRRAVEWIQHDRKDYWRRQVRQGYDQVAHARAEYERCLMFHVGDDRPSCYDEKVALEAAKRRLRIAEEKVEAVRRWTHTVVREVHEYRGSVGQLTHWLQADLPRAVAALDRMARALESYVALGSPAETAAAASRGSPVEESVEEANAQDAAEKASPEESPQAAEDGRDLPAPDGANGDGPQETER